VNLTDYEFVITHPEGYELAPEFAGNAKVIHNQDEALKGADFVYGKNWSSYTHYGQVLTQDHSWMITKGKMDLTNNGLFMHCLPVRRNLKVTDEVLDHRSVVIQQAANREWSAQAVLKNILKGL
jgi:N-succinyl-L-ornithine transcarbamylase